MAIVEDNCALSEAGHSPFETSPDSHVCDRSFRDFQPYIRRYTSPNENFENSVPILIHYFRLLTLSNQMLCYKSKCIRINPRTLISVRKT